MLSSFQNWRDIYWITWQTFIEMKLPDIFNVVEKMSRSNIFIDLIISVIWHHRLQNRIWERKIENKDNTSKHSPIKYKYWDFPSSVIRGRLLITLAWLIKIPFPIFLKYLRIGNRWWQFKIEPRHSYWCLMFQLFWFNNIGIKLVNYLEEGKRISGKVQAALQKLPLPLA